MKTLIIIVNIIAIVASIIATDYITAIWAFNSLLWMLMCWKSEKINQAL